MHQSVSSAEVQRSLGLPDETMAWLTNIDRSSDSQGPVLPDDAQAEQLLGRLGVDPVDRADTLTARPNPDNHPHMWWVLDRAYHQLLSAIGEVVPIEGFAGYPALPPSTGAMGRHLPVWTYLAVLPAIRRYHADRGIPDDLSWHSLAEAFGYVMRAHRAMTGASGMGLWGFGWTLALRFRGVDYQLGRLSFNLGAISFGNGACGYALGVHIPGGRPLAPVACDESFARAREFFPHHFPDYPVTFFTCESWLMDPQLAEYLPDTSNILRFQRRFKSLRLDPHDETRLRSDHDILEYVFGRGCNEPEVPAELLDELPQNTSLRRAYVAHLRSGGHWCSRTGWLPLHDNH